MRSIEEYLKAKGELSATILLLEVYSFLARREWANWDPSEYMSKQSRILSERFPTLHDYVVATKRWVGKSPVPA